MDSTTEAPIKARILIVEDDETISRLLKTLLVGESYAVEAVNSGEEGLEALRRSDYDLALLDLHLPGMSGTDVLASAASLHLGTQFIMMTAFGSVATAIEAMRLGAFHYLTKPLRTEELFLTLERALQAVDLRRELTQLRRKVGEGGSSGIIGQSLSMQRLLEQVTRVAPTRATVLLLGETGTGKELVARSIHDLSDRSRKSFVAVQCSALPESLLESELFGHVRGSFTGAIQDRRGLFEEANGGTLFLDEITTIPPSTQIKLLRVLQERKVLRVGGNKPIPTDFRLVAATNEDVSEAVRAGQFREDLFYRLNVCPIRIPPLRERIEDIPLLANHFRARVAQEMEIPASPIPPDEMQALTDYDWPGNVRELEHCIQRAVIMGAGLSELRFELPRSARSRTSQDLLQHALDEEWSLARLEQEYTIRVLQKMQGNKNRAAEILRMDRRTLYRKLKEYGADDTASEIVAAAPAIASRPQPLLGAAVARGSP
jgi:DNA-binding NtrC family response regulator